MHYHFWLVQRLEPDFKRKGGVRVIDGVACEYMGSTEFECGTVPAARERLDTCTELVTVTHDITINQQTRPVHFLGALSTIEEKIAAMQEWIDRGLRGQESSHFDTLFMGLDFLGRPIGDYYQTVVWWALEEDLVWSLEQQYLTLFIEQRKMKSVPLGTL